MPDMTDTHPLHPLHQQAGATFTGYGPATENAIELVESFGAYEAEYAAIRKAVGVMDQPHRGLVRLTGGDRIEYLQRLLTNDVADLAPGAVRRAFRLNNKGRITADVTVLQYDDRTDIELDATDAGGFAADLDRYLFSEDVQVADLTQGHTHIALFGPSAHDVLNHAAGTPAVGLEPLTHVGVQIASRGCTVFRRDETGGVGLHVVVARDAAVEVYKALLEHQPTAGVKPIGWLAYNTARIEAGTPLFHIDFGPDSLPHETGALLDGAVSFTKGCYAGQEVVARMQNLGHPKRVLVGLRVESDSLPIAGTQVFDRPGGGAEGSQIDRVVGAITSSAVSPMLSGSPVAFAMVKWSKRAPDTPLAVAAEGRIHNATVHGLAFI